jgi:hypothetical protein
MARIFTSLPGYLQLELLIEGVRRGIWAYVHGYSVNAGL